MFQVIENKTFIGREHEKQRLLDISAEGAAEIITVYGRRRVGKTELLEQTFRKRNILKFEGLEKLDENEQLMAAKLQLGVYFKQLAPSDLQKIVNWHTFLMELARLTKTGVWTIYFEELQWLANYKPHFISYLKYVWDNYFRHNKKLIILLCGSSPSFMINYVVRSKALYNRSQHDMHLKEFSLSETKNFLKNKSIHETLNAYLTVGGIPEYLKKLNKKESVFINLCKNSFFPDSFFASEYEKIFISTLSKNAHYENIVNYLSNHKFATREKIAKHLDIKLGGYLSTLLNELEELGLITRYSPYNLAKNSKISRYAINDAYLQYYFKFIKPIKENINNGKFTQNPTKAINTQYYNQWLGYAFERFCRKYHHLIAKILGFGAIDYTSGVFYSKKTNADEPGFQIDLIFKRSDNVFTLCEIKYLNQPATLAVGHEFEKKLALFPNPAHKTIHSVLICNYGADNSLASKPFFDDVITATELFKQ